jgi:hypothetical protein
MKRGSMDPFHGLAKCWSRAAAHASKDGELPRDLTSVLASERPEKLRSFGDFLRSFVEIRAREQIWYPFCHGLCL